MSTSEESNNTELSISVEPNGGAEVLNSIIDLVADGRQLDDGELRRLYGVLDEFQAKIDVAQVGQTIGALGRQKRLNGLIEALETDLIGINEEEMQVKLLLMDGDTKVKLLKLLISDRQKQVEYISSRATSPALSGPEKMAGSLKPASSDSSMSQRLLPPDQRRRVVKILDMLVKGSKTTVDSESPSD